MASMPSLSQRSNCKNKQSSEEIMAEAVFLVHEQKKLGDSGKVICSILLFYVFL